MNHVAGETLTFKDSNPCTAARGALNAADGLARSALRYAERASLAIEECITEVDVIDVRAQRRAKASMLEVRRALKALRENELPIVAKAIDESRIADGAAPPGGTLGAWADQFSDALDQVDVEVLRFDVGANPPDTEKLHNLLQALRAFVASMRCEADELENAAARTSESASAPSPPSCTSEAAE